MSAEGPRLLRPAEAGSPVDRLWLALPAEWRGPVIGPGVEDWARICDHGERRLDLTGLPGQIARELAWMAHWQAADGTRSSAWTGMPPRRCRDGSMPPGGGDFLPKAPAGACGSSSGSPGLPCWPAA